MNKWTKGYLSPLLHQEINAEDESRMTVEETVAPEIDVPVLEGGVVTGTGAWAYPDASYLCTRL
jgi:hypothetical protein